MEELNKGIEIFKVLKQIMAEMKQSVHQEFKELNITGPQVMLVGALIHHGEMKMTDISESMGLTNSTISGIVDRLEKQGFVERIRSNEDRRVVFVKVTDEFRENAKHLFSQVEKKFETIVNEASSEEIDKIFEGINLLRGLLERQQQKKGVDQ